MYGIKEDTVSAKLTFPAFSQYSLGGCYMRDQWRNNFVKCYLLALLIHVKLIILVTFTIMIIVALL